MSNWVHISGAILCNAKQNKQETNQELRTRLKKLITNKAPKIKGSEGNADVFINVCMGYNTWISADCYRCKFKDTIIHKEDGGFTCEAEEGFECPDGEYQDEIIITIADDLRDTNLEQVSKEIDEFIKFVKEEIAYEIRVISIKAHEDWTGKERTW